MTEPLRVLIVEDIDTDAKLVVRELRRGNRAVESLRVDDAAAMRAALAGARWDVVVSDWSLPGFSALEALRIARSADPEMPFIVVTGTIGEDVAVEAIRAGVDDYLLKDRLTRLASSVDRELRERDDRRTAALALRESEQRNTALEDQLRQSQKLEAIGSLAGGIAHDFNNLLSVIISYGDMMGEEDHGNPVITEFAEQIVSAGRRAADLTRQLLAFSRRQILEPCVLDPNEVLVEMHKMLRRLLGEAVELAVVPGSDVGHIKVDPGQFEQVIMNLAVNARDAMPGGGKLTIETSSVDLSEESVRHRVGVTSGRYVMIAMSDNGTGMDRETQARIFEPFFTTKPLGKGTGLGLSTVFGIVRQSEGHIWVYSEPGHGTTFKIYMPRIAAADRSSRPLLPAPRTLRGDETILLVEDEDGVRTLAHTILSRHGYRVLDATSPGDALLICEQNEGPIHLMISDVVMPRMSGRQLADRLRAIRPDMKVLYMSGYTDHAIVDHGVLEPGLAFLQKPLTPDSLARKVREVLESG